MICVACALSLSAPVMSPVPPAKQASDMLEAVSEQDVVPEVLGGMEHFSAALCN